MYNEWKACFHFMHVITVRGMGVSFLMHLREWGKRWKIITHLIVPITFESYKLWNMRHMIITRDGHYRTSVLLLPLTPVDSKKEVNSIRFFNVETKPWGGMDLCLSAGVYISKCCEGWEANAPTFPILVDSHPACPSEGLTYVENNFLNSLGLIYKV